ncbi:hypothetical protein JB92DRAFT_3095009 [Gautieria morchelliformis]|nr:hypothetical protein JB92DRAFT_3095009 [Gautieria morchelliformis]
MAPLSLSFTLLFTLIISVISAPVPIPYPQAIATGPVTSGELTVPTRGGTFNDFKNGTRSLHDDTDQFLAPTVSESDGVDQESTFWSRSLELYPESSESRQDDRFNAVSGHAKEHSSGQNGKASSHH